MKRKARDPNKPIGRMTRVRDFLPPPSELAVPEETVKITLALSKSSVEFFRHEAMRRHTRYQRMIRELVDQYASRYSQP